MTIRETTICNDGSYDLLCAHRRCFSDLTHHVAVDIHARAKGEDGETVSYRVYDKEFRITDGHTFKENPPTPSIKYNPSDRRDGVSITYCCENCGRYSRLTIAQHKGNTFLATEALE